MQDTERLRGEVKLVNKRNVVLEAEAQDLAQQVQVTLLCAYFRLIWKQHLLNQVQHLKNGTPTPQSPQVLGRTSSEVITSTLVSFDDIQQLQQKNQELLRLVRELATKSEQEEEEQAATVLQKVRSAWATEDLIDAQVVDELNRLKEVREKESEQVAVIIKQNNMYRFLLNQAEEERSRKSEVIHAKLTRKGLIALQQNKSVSMSSDAVAPSQPDEEEKNREYEKLLQEKELNENRLEKQINQLGETISKLQREIGRKDTQLELLRERTEEMAASRVWAEVAFVLKPLLGTQQSWGF